MNHDLHLQALLRRLLRRSRSLITGNKWPGAEIGKHATLDANEGRILPGKKTRIADWSMLSTEFGGEILIGERCTIHRGALLLSYGGRIEIGDECSVNPYCILYGHGGLRIGNGVRIAAHTVVIPANHRFDDTDRPIRQQPLSKKGIIIEDDVWIGAGVRILDGVVIHQGAVIGAGAVVTRNVPPFTINAGVPSRMIGQRKTASTVADLHGSNSEQT